MYYKPLIANTSEFVYIYVNYHTSLALSREVIWSHKFKDSVLDIVGTKSGKILLGLADGNIAMLKVSGSHCHDVTDVCHFILLTKFIVRNFPLN